MKKTIHDLRGAIALLLALVLVLGMSACGTAGPIGIPAPDADADAFTDVPGWCSDAVGWAYGQGITSGTGDNRFSPDDPCSNAQIITMLWRAAGKPEASKAFPGTVQGAYKDAMDWAYSGGMIGANADPGQTCVRAGAMLLIWKTFGSPDASADTGFSDVSYGAGYAKAVGWAVSSGIAAGLGNGRFGPMEPCTRGHIVTFLHRAYVPEVRLDTGNGGNATPGTADDTAAEKELAKYGTIQTLVKSVGNPTAADSSNKQTTSYGTVDWSTAAQGCISFTAAGQERVFVLQRPDGQYAIFDVAKDTTAKIALTGSTGDYQYIIGRNTEDKSAYYADYKNTIRIGRIDTDLAPYLISTPYGDYANAPDAMAKSKGLYDSGKTRLENVQAMAEYVDGLKYDMSLKQGGSSAYVNPDTVIANGGGVCNEMSKLLVAMLRSQGIPSYYQGGTESGDSHAWAMAWVELSAETKDGVTYSKGAWVLVEATNGKVQTRSAAASYVPVNCAG